MKYFRWFIYILGAISFIILLTIMIVRDHVGKKEFCDKSFNGKIVKIVPDIKNYYEVSIENDTTYYLGMSIRYKIVPIEVGDTIIKEKNCYKVLLRKNGRYYDISIPLRECPCNK